MKEGTCFGIYTQRKIMYFGIYTHNKHDKNSSDGVLGLFVLQCVCSLVLL